MPSLRAVLVKFLGCLVLITGFAFASVAPCAAHPEAHLLIEADSGKVLEAENATMPWHPASLTKLMTAYVTLTAVKEGRITLDTLLTVSPTASAQSPSKMGFAPGVKVTVDNALKMMLVKSANDMAVVLAEGVGGSIDGFSAMMNQTAQRLGMTQTNYVNPNGLPDDRQITSARDLAILARAIFRDLPEYTYFVHIPSIRYGRRVTRNYNKLIGRFPGADGMKTGFICASGFNLIASATQNGRHLIAVVLGASSSRMRSIKAIKLLEKGFAANTLAWLKPALGTVDHLAPMDAAAPDLHDVVCGPKRKRQSDDPDDDIASVVDNNPALSFFADGLKPALRPEDILDAAPAPSEPVVVYTGATKTSAELAAAEAAAQQAAARRHKARTARQHHRGKHVATDDKPGSKSDKRTTVVIDTHGGKHGAKTSGAGDSNSKAAKPSDKAGHKSKSRSESRSAHKPARPKSKTSAQN